MIENRELGTTVRAIGGTPLNFSFVEGKGVVAWAKRFGQWQQIRTYDLPQSLRALTNKVELKEILSQSSLPTVRFFSNGDVSFNLNLGLAGGMFGRTKNLLEKLEKNPPDVVTAAQLKTALTAVPNIRELTHKERMTMKEKMTGGYGVAGGALAAGGYMLFVGEMSMKCAAIGGLPGAVAGGAFGLLWALKEIKDNEEKVKDAEDVKRKYNSWITEGLDVALKDEELTGLGSNADNRVLARLVIKSDKLLKELQEDNIIEFSDLKFYFNEDCDFFKKIRIYFENSEFLLVLLKMNLLSSALALRHIKNRDVQLELSQSSYKHEENYVKVMLYPRWADLISEINSFVDQGVENMDYLKNIALGSSGRCYTYCGDEGRAKTAYGDITRLEKNVAQYEAAQELAS